MDCSLAMMSVAASSYAPIANSIQPFCSSPSTASTRFFCRPKISIRSRIVAMATPSSDIGEKLKQSIREAEELCGAEGSGGECAAAWDEVEELSAEIAHKRVKASAEEDPLEQYCKDAPEAEECRVYED